MTRTVNYQSCTERNTIKTWGCLFAIGLLGLLGMMIIAFTTLFMMIIDKFN